MAEYYEIDNRLFRLERTSSGYYRLNITEKDSDNTYEYEYLFQNKTLALEEIVSYSEVEEPESEVQ